MRSAHLDDILDSFGPGAKGEHGGEVKPVHQLLPRAWEKRNDENLKINEKSNFSKLAIQDLNKWPLNCGQHQLSQDCVKTHKFSVLN